VTQLAAFPALDICKPARTQQTTWCATEAAAKKNTLGTLGFRLLGSQLVRALALALGALAATLAAAGPRTASSGGGGLASGLASGLAASLHTYNRATHTPHPKRGR